LGKKINGGTKEKMRIFFLRICFVILISSVQREEIKNYDKSRENQEAGAGKLCIEGKRIIHISYCLSFDFHSIVRL
jgi:hypothetical protein